MIEVSDYQQAKYLKSVADLAELLPDNGAEIAFIGRSNAGKSSALNTITGIKGLARTSKTPGRTQMINFFGLNRSNRLVDLPGYGYAKVPLTVKERWEQNVDEYLRCRKSLRGLVVVMDIRHPLKELDLQVVNWAIDCNVPLLVLLTKADKLKPNAARKTLKEVKQQLDYPKVDITVQLFSSIDRTGLEEVRDQLTDWFCSE